MIQFEKFTLSNGLRVLVHEDNSTPMAVVNIMYDVGAKDENPQKTGFAHLFEHLMFGPSEHSHGRFTDAVEKIGATNQNGTTKPSCGASQFTRSTRFQAIWMPVSVRRRR